MALAIALSWRVAVAGDRLTGKVVSVHDGDTITVLVNRRQVKVRLSGIDAPELGQGFGQAAKRHLSDLVFGKVVEVGSAGLDRWGRTLGTVKVDGKPVAEAMVASGYAWHYVAYSDDKQLAAAEAAARAARNGLWSDSAPEPPWEWRKHEKARKQPAAAPQTHSVR
jgi:endonuclease YncB( thermonuclease family)